MRTENHDLLQVEKWNRERKELNARFTEIVCKITKNMQYRQHSLS